MSIAAASDFERAPSNPLITRLAIAAACTVLADWLFIGWQNDLWGWQIGISLALFFGVLGVVAVASNRVRATRKLKAVMSVVFVAGLLALVEDVDVLSAILATLATALFVIVMTARETTSWQRQLFEAATVPFRGPFQLARDLFGALRHMKTQTPGWLGWLVAWIERADPAYRGGTDCAERGAGSGISPRSRDRNSAERRARCKGLARGSAAC
jgi:hypothetical protein